MCSDRCPRAGASSASDHLAVTSDLLLHFPFPRCVRVPCVARELAGGEFLQRGSERAEPDCPSVTSAPPRRRSVASDRSLSAWHFCSSSLTRGWGGRGPLTELVINPRVPVLKVFRTGLGAA